MKGAGRGSSRIPPSATSAAPLPANPDVEGQASCSAGRQRLALPQGAGSPCRQPCRHRSPQQVQPSRTVAAAGELAARHRLRLDPGDVQRALDGVPQPSEEQRSAVLAATTRDDLALIVGRAGAGKTTAAATIAEAYRDAGYDVVGAALAGKAADTLQQEAGIHSRTLHSWEYSWGRREETLDRRIVLVIDEAGMVDARQLSRVLDHATAHDAKVILREPTSRLPREGRSLQAARATEPEGPVGVMASACMEKEVARTTGSPSGPRA
jgi:hypothetical protein